MDKLAQIMIGAALVAGAGGLGFGVAAWADAPKHPGRVIKVTARRFTFSPSNIVLKKGETVDLELSTADVLMGFNAPDFNQRSDITPGQAIHVTLTADKVGTFAFLCDIFCGSGHENMNGTITVTE